MGAIGVLTADCPTVSRDQVRVDAGGGAVFVEGEIQKYVGAFAERPCSLPRQLPHHFIHYLTIRASLHLRGACFIAFSITLIPIACIRWKRIGLTQLFQ